jgi:hypothetical protein
MMDASQKVVDNKCILFWLDREVPASEKTALMAVMEADEERVKLEKLAEELATREDEESQEYLMQVITYTFIWAHFI